MRDDSGITKDNAKELEGKKVATPTGNVTHYKLLRTLDHLGVDSSKVDIVQMNGADAAVALVRGDVTMACAFGGPIDRMRTVGKPLMTGAEQEAVGINTFDIISATDSFANGASGPAEEVPRRHRRGERRLSGEPDAALDTIAGAAGMDGPATKAMMANFAYPTIEEQLGPNWLGGGVQEAAKGVAEVMVADRQPRQGARRLFALRRPELPEVSAAGRRSAAPHRRPSRGRAAVGHPHRGRLHGLFAARRRQRAGARPHLARRRRRASS